MPVRTTTRLGPTGLLLGALAATTACGSPAPRAVNAAPPTVICGTTLSSAAAGAVVYDVARPDSSPPTLTSVTVGGYLFLQVSDDCRHGVDVTWSPPDEATLVSSALAEDGRPAAVVLQPRTLTSDFQLIEQRDGAQMTVATVQL